MKKVMVLIAVVGFVFLGCEKKAVESKEPTMEQISAAKEVMLKGIIIDNLCAGTNKAKLAEFVKTHTKECAVMPNCEASGYSIYADGTLQAFDDKSNTMIIAFLKDPKSKLKVNVTVKEIDGKLMLIKIGNQK